MSTCAKDCHPDEVQKKWEITAGILGQIWGEILPRMVAYAWEQGDDLRAAVNSLADFQTYMNNLPHVFNPAISPPPTRAFEEAWDAVDTYINNATAAGTAVPVDIPGDGGFDFVFSDCGLEMFVPRKPRDIEELLRFYTFREAGRPVLGFPRYDVPGPREITSPTGPSQVRMRFSSVVQNLCFSEVGPDCWADVMNCLALHLEMPSLFEASHFERLAHTHGKPGQEEEFIRILEELEIENTEVQLSMEAYTCALEPLRCWQLSGAVFRGIMVTLPRIIAEIWHERALRPPPWNGQLNTGNAGPLWVEFRDQPRSIFRKRLETSIPDSNRMEFRSYDPANPPGEVKITNKGICLPRPQTMPPTEAAAMNSIYGEISNGKAGNPVFTDSKTSI